MSEQQLKVLEDTDNKGNGDTQAEMFYEDHLKNVSNERELVEAFENRKSAVEYVIVWHKEHEHIVDLLSRFADKTMIRLTAPMPGMIMGGVLDPKTAEKEIPDDIFERYVAQIEENHNRIKRGDDDVPEHVTAEGKKTVLLKNVH